MLNFFLVLAENEEINKVTAPLIDSLISKLLESASLAMNNRFYETANAKHGVRESLIEA